MTARQRFEAIPTRTPLDDAASVARGRALESIERQFSVTSKVAIPAILVAVAVLAFLPFLGNVPAAAVTLLAASFTVLAGVAARPLIENAIAGLVISASKLVNLGDTVQLGDIYGTVEDITPTHTTIKVWDWRRFVVPNSQMMQSSLLNLSLYDRFLWARVEFWVSYDADLEAVRREAVALAELAPHFGGFEAPECWVMETGEHAVRLWVAAWARTPSDAWLLSHEIRLGLVSKFQEMKVLPRIYEHRVAGDGRFADGDYRSVRSNP
ncbi:MAG: mechanosensitive ion channel [Myxococcales bacterium]|nr:mechanosensitive ion channel [Myxococcales bacterium]